MYSRRHKLHETYVRCGCKWSEMRVLWCRPIFKKCWKFILHFDLNVCLVNCFILYELTNHPPSTANGNKQLTIRRNLVRQLIGTFTSRKHTGRKRISPIELYSLTFSILYKKYQAVQNVCFVYREKEKCSIRKG